MATQTKTKRVLSPINVIELSRDQLTLCNTNSATPLVLKFPSTTIADMEVINPAELESLIKDFVTRSQITPSPLVIIISSSAYFETDLSTVAKEEEGEKIQAF